MNIQAERRFGFPVHVAVLFQGPVCNGHHFTGAVPQRGHLVLGQPGAGRGGGAQGGAAAVAGPVGRGVDAAVGRRPLQEVVAVELRLRALPAVEPFLIAVSTGGVAGQGIAAGMAGVVAVRLQKEQQNYGNGEEKRKVCKCHHRTLGALLPGGTG